MPAAQFSVSKYQLMPQTGTVAAITAASGRPSCSAWLSAARTEKRAARMRTAYRRRWRSHAVASRSSQRGGAASSWRGIPAPHRPLDPSRRPAPEQVERIDHEQRDEGGDQHVAGDGNGRREQPEQRAIGTHAADVNREERGDERQDPAAIDRRARRLGGLDLRRHRRRRAGCPEIRARRRPTPRRRPRCGPAKPRCSRPCRRSATRPQRPSSTPRAHSRPTTSSSATARLPSMASTASRRDRRSVSRHALRPVPDRVDEKEPRHAGQERRAGKIRGVDEEQRDHHADERADRRLAGVRRRSIGGCRAAPRTARRRRAGNRAEAPAIRGAEGAHEREDAEQDRRRTSGRRPSGPCAGIVRARVLGRVS